ncbi:MAG TPA: thiamine phosphate synthase [Candidatus Limnocylindrales bacterium]|nr:thiamine phosphate synthase [Candidatus Limnocylindrales bacterium]
MTTTLPFALYLVTDRGAARRGLVDVVEECLEAGLRAVQLREKDLGVREMLDLAAALRETTRRHGARLILNDRADVAMAVGADGVQRTHTSLPVGALRSVVGNGSLIGASVHSLADAQGAAQDGADFLVFGPIYDTPSKRQYGAPQGLDALAHVAKSVARPVIAVGGITPERVRPVLEAGAAGVAVITAILAADRPADATKSFLDALGHA